MVWFFRSYLCSIICTKLLIHVNRGGERSRLRLLSQGKRAEEAGMISLTTKTRANIQTQIKLRLITASLPKRAK